MHQPDRNSNRRIQLRALLNNHLQPSTIFPARIHDVKLPPTSSQKDEVVIRAFDELWDEKGGSARNVSGDLSSYKNDWVGSHGVGPLLSPNMGKFSAANETDSLRSTFTEIQLTFLTGICGGVLDPWKANELVLGDVVVSKNMIQYDLGRHCGSTRTTTL